MIASYKRVLVAVFSTGFLHASLFYTLNEVKQPQIAPNKTIEIEIMQELKQEKKVQKPKPVIKPKPKPIVKPKPAPVVKPKPAEVKEDLIEEVLPKEELIEPETPQEPKTSLEETTINDDAKASKVNADILERYLYEVRVKIQKNLRYPPLAKRLKIQGESVVAFNILKDGRVEESTITTYKSSKNSSLDAQAIRTILQVSPFGAPPSGQISIIVPVAFNLK
jgi:TonB family protein